MLTQTILRKRVFATLTAVYLFVSFLIRKQKRKVQ